MNFITNTINIQSIVEKNFEFLIPVYQRPYVWDDTEIKKLLEDLKHNFEVNTTEYFVGNTYAIKSNNENKPNQYEVIDGQQRFTTFWLISLCFELLNVKTKLTEYLRIEKNKDIRFDFDIRKEVYEYLKGQLDGSAHRRFENVEKLEFLKNIAAGIETIKGILNSSTASQIKINLEAFGDYIYEKVMFVFNEAPDNTDLNALFVALGTSGIQLQQSDILKARLLDKIIEKDKRIIYAKIWEACENMNNYFESNVKISFPYDTSKVTEIDFKKYNAEKFNYNSDFEELNIEKAITISEIIEFDTSVEIKTKNKSDSNTECRSIITFNLFLLHALRIFKKQIHSNNDIISMDSKKLLEIFDHEKQVFKNENEEVTSKNVKDFFELLWQIRYNFDKHIVKWLKDEDESTDEDEKLLLSYINTSKNNDKSYFSRSEKEFSSIQMLQSVLYFNNMPTQFWLTPFLSFLIENHTVTDVSILKELEKIDNIMIPGNKKEMTWNILNNQFLMPNFEKIASDLNLSRGTSFDHYWFYKLEYLLWKNWDKNDLKYKKYRITSKNSIEHVFPQNQEYKISLNDLGDDIDWLNSIGNLALLSVGQNSEYSNHSFIVKKDRFKAKEYYDSLKTAKIFNCINWNTEQIKQHQEEMILILNEHYKN